VGASIEVGEWFSPAFLFAGTGVRRGSRCAPVDWEGLDLRAVPEIEGALERRVEDLGFELVELKWAGSGRRPVLQVRIDREGSTRLEGITVDECAKVSRALEEWLDDHESISERYVLEVSSPGVDRPLTKRRDFDRFRGERVALKGKEVLWSGSNRVDGELLGLEGEDEGSDAVRIRLDGGEEVAVPRSKIRKAHLVFSWK